MTRIEAIFCETKLNLIETLKIHQELPTLLVSYFLSPNPINQHHAQIHWKGFLYNSNFQFISKTSIIRFEMFIQCSVQFFGTKCYIKLRIHHLAHLVVQLKVLTKKIIEWLRKKQLKQRILTYFWLKALFRTKRTKYNKKKMTKWLNHIWWDSKWAKRRYREQIFEYVYYLHRFMKK